MIRLARFLAADIALRWHAWRSVRHQTLSQSHRRAMNVEAAVIQQIVHSR